MLFISFYLFLHLFFTFLSRCWYAEITLCTQKHFSTYHHCVKDFISCIPLSFNIIVSFCIICTSINKLHLFESVYHWTLNDSADI